MFSAVKRVSLSSFLMFKLNNVSWRGTINLLNTTQASKKCAILVPHHEIKWIAVISNPWTDLNTLCFSCFFQNASWWFSDRCKVSLLIYTHRFRSCGSFQGSICWVSSTSESYKIKQSRYFLFALLFNSTIFKINPHNNLILVQTFENRFQNSEIQVKGKYCNMYMRTERC